MPTQPVSTEEERRHWREKSRKRYLANPEAWKRKYQENRDELLAGHHARGLPCRGCGTMRFVAAKDREKSRAAGGPLCHECRRAEAAKMLEGEARIRERRLAKRAADAPPRRESKGSGRAGTGNRRYRRNRVTVLMASDVCGLCGHPGSATVDHIVSARYWPKGVPGMDDVENLQPAHGTMGGTGLVNRCPTCGLLCNQVRGVRGLAAWRAARTRAAG